MGGNTDDAAAAAGGAAAATDRGALALTAGAVLGDREGLQSVEGWAMEDVKAVALLQQTESVAATDDAMDAEEEDPAAALVPADSVSSCVVSKNVDDVSQVFVGGLPRTATAGP